MLDTIYRALSQKLNHSRERAGAYKTLEGIEHLDKVIHVDQSPIGRTPRSNPATYTGLFTHIRELFAQLPEARMRGYGPGRFSFNVKGGRCEACEGDGIIRIEMHFLPDVYVTCEVCGGKRYNRDTLEIQYKGKSISEVLNMTVLDAILAVGGLSQFASGNRSRIVRMEHGKETTIHVKLADLVNSGDVKQNLPLKAGDVLVVPQSMF